MRWYRALPAGTVVYHFELLFEACSHLATHHDLERGQRLETLEAAMSLARVCPDARMSNIAVSGAIPSGILNLRSAARKLEAELDEALLAW